MFRNFVICLLDTVADHQQQLDVERLLGTEIDNLRAQLEKKDKEIRGKAIALKDLQNQHTELDAKLKVAQQDANVDLINHLKETKEGLVQKLKHGQDELKTLKEDKATYKNTVDFIVSRDTWVKKNFLKKAIILQRKLEIEQKIVTDIKQELERVHIVANEYKEQKECLRQEKRDLELRFSQHQEAAKEENALHEIKVKEMTELIQHLRQQINQAHLANDDQRSQFEENIQALQTQHGATVAVKAEEIKHLREQIVQADTVSQKQIEQLQEEQRAFKAHHYETIAGNVEEIKRLRKQIVQADTVSQKQIEQLQEEQRAFKAHHYETIAENVEEIKHLREQIVQAQAVSQKQRDHFQEEQRALQAYHNETIKENVEEIKHLRELIVQAQAVREEEKEQFQEQHQALQTQYDATVTEMTEKIEHMKDEIQHLKDSLQRASSPPPLVGGLFKL